jgi:hypothetical protein
VVRPPNGESVLGGHWQVKLVPYAELREIRETVTLWHACCIATFMSMLTDADQAFLFLLVSACLGACFVWAFWELEQARERWRQRSRDRAKLTWKR